MYKIIIVDDEVYELESFAEAVQWSKFDIEYPKMFDNPEEALNYIYENDVDIVITDIRMPEMSGIDLIKKINEYSSDIATIIISAFADFEYAKAAIGLNVFGYILKPIKFRELEEILTKAVEKISKKTLQNPKSDMLYCRQVINDFLCGEENDLKEIQKAISTEGYNKAIGNVALVRVEIGDFQEFLVNVWHHEADRLYNFICSQLLRVIPEFFSVMITSFFGTLDLVVISGYDDLNRFCFEINEMTKKFPYILEEGAGIKINMKVLNTYKNLNDASKTASEYINLYKTNPVGIKKKVLIEHAIDFINHNYMKDISLDDVSRQINYTPYYFSKYFKRETGENFINYLNRIRLNHAKELLDNTDERAVSIARKVGYNSKNHFYKMFKLYYGCTPIEYRRRNGGDANE